MTQPHTVLRALLIGTALMSPAAARQSAQTSDDSGVSGVVVAPGGAPVSRGTVRMQSPVGRRTTSPIDETGGFRAVPNGSGVYQLLVSVPDFAPYRASVDVPRSQTMRLPLIMLSPATYFRARFTSAAGEPIISPQLRWRSFDAHGPVAMLSDDGSGDQIGSDGAITIGPLPRGITSVAIDTIPFAQTQLPDLSVTGEKALFDVGTIVVQPGAVLQVDVVDESGAPVRQHEVALEHVRPRSQLSFRPVRTDQNGRATFERLSGGRYRLRTAATARCGGQLLSIAPLVTVPAVGAAHARLVVSGHASFRVTSSLGALRGIRVSASPETVVPAPPASPIATVPTRAPACDGSTDGDGRVTLENFPPGPARVDVRLLNSTVERRVDVPLDGQEVPIAIPDGFLPARVTDARTSDPISGAAIVWTTGSGRVEAISSGTGDVLLEGVGTAGGTLGYAKGGYKSIEESLPEPPAVLHEAALDPTPDRRLQAVVVMPSGESLPGAVVELTSRDPMEIPRISVTDPKGLVTFPDAPPGTLRLTAYADGFVTAAASVDQERRTKIVLTLARDARRR